MRASVLVRVLLLCFLSVYFFLTCQPFHLGPHTGALQRQWLLLTLDINCPVAWQERQAEVM